MRNLFWITTVSLNLFVSSLLPAGPKLSDTKPAPSTLPAQLTAEQRTEVAKLVAQLDSEDFKTREAATQKLKDMGLAVVPVLRGIAASANLSQEVKAKIDLISDSLSPLSVRIVPSLFQDDGSKLLAPYNQIHFHVVVTNTSTRPINLWHELADGAYSNISFEVTDEKGGKTTIARIKRLPLDRKSNSSYHTLPPGDHIVFKINFGDKTWENLPLLDQDESKKIKMKAVYSIPKDDRTQKCLIWTGTVCSPEETYIYR